jgi:hypothetical protein
MNSNLEHVSNMVLNISQLAKSRKNQRSKKSNLGQTLNFKGIGPKMPF